MEYFLGVDGGGSKTKFILADCNLNIVKSVIKEGCDFHRVGVDGVCKIFLDGTQLVLKEQGENFNCIKGAAWGIPRYGEAVNEDKQITSYLKKMLPKTELGFFNDVDLGIAGSLALESGIHIVSGTGAIAIGKDENGNTFRCSGWDEHFGDEGSSYWLGMETLKLFTMESDGRKPKGSLYKIVKDSFNLQKDFDLIDYFYSELHEKREKIAGVQFLLYKAAIEGDFSAVELYKEAAFELSRSVKMLINKIDFKKKPITVSYSGGTFKAGDLILKPFQSFLSGYSIKLVNPIFEPGIGAILLASKGLVDKELYRNLK